MVWGDLGSGRFKGDSVWPKMGRRDLAGRCAGGNLLTPAWPLILLCDPVAGSRPFPVPCGTADAARPAAAKALIAVHTQHSSYVWC